MLILRALTDVFLIGFWSFVIWCGGPGHGSYGYALIARRWARDRLKQNYFGGSSGEEEGAGG